MIYADLLQPRGRYLDDARVDYAAGARDRAEARREKARALVAKAEADYRELVLGTAERQQQQLATSAAAQGAREAGTNGEATQSETW